MVPRVSIIIPVYNGADYMREAIDSALAQTYPNCEVIVINDGSNDDGRTDSIAREYGNRIVYFAKANGGVASALNLGIEKMTGEYFSWLSHDDIYHENKIEAQVKYLREHPETTITYCDFEMIDRMSRRIRLRKLRSVPSNQFRYSIVINSLVNGCTFLIPKSCFDQCGLFDESLKIVQDYDMWFRLASAYTIDHFAEVLVRSRYHINQGTRRFAGLVKAETDNLVIRQLKTLSRDEIVRATGMSLRLSYMYIAECLENRGLAGGKSLAVQLARKTKEQLSLAQKFNLFLVMYLKMPVARLKYFIREFIVYPFRAFR
jgi:glycosyltransferase involved in cell wall biosynthesis